MFLTEDQRIELWSKYTRIEAKVTGLKAIVQNSIDVKEKDLVNHKAVVDEVCEELQSIQNLLSSFVEDK